MILALYREYPVMVHGHDIHFVVYTISLYNHSYPHMISLLGKKIRHEPLERISRVPKLAYSILKTISHARAAGILSKQRKSLAVYFTGRYAVISFKFDRTHYHFRHFIRSADVLQRPQYLFRIEQSALPGIFYD
jgi:hypothetical protein